MDAARLKASWARVAGYGDAAPAHFYAVLFAAHPELRGMFPPSMASQRDRLVSALGHIVSNVNQLDAVTPFVQGLGDDHRKFEVRPEHYGPIGEALLATLGYFLGEAWTPDLATDWASAYGLIARVMGDAAEQASAARPPWWAATVVDRQRRGLDVAVLRIQPEQPYPYWPGQSCAVEIPERPRLWRYYSPANYPRRDGLIELHVKAVPGGQVSTAIVHGLQPGDEIRLGAPIGHRLTLDPYSARDLLLVAGGTGLAPLKALVEQVAVEGGQRRAALSSAPAPPPTCTTCPLWTP
jgi:hemoglobin-like flavoprotein